MAIVVPLVLTPFAKRFYPALEPYMPDLLWQVPSAALAIFFACRIFLAPRWLDEEQEQKTEALHKEQEQKITTLQARLDAIEQSQAQIDLTGIRTSFIRRIPTEKKTGNYEDVFFVYATFRNESPRSEETAVAKKVVALISYHDKEGQQIGPVDLGEWWEGLEPPPPTQIPREELASAEFKIGESKILSIAFKTKDGGSYGFCCYSRSCPGWRLKKLRLPKEEYAVKITLQGVNVPQATHTLFLKNPGPSRPFEPGSSFELLESQQSE